MLCNTIYIQHALMGEVIIGSRYELLVLTTCVRNAVYDYEPLFVVFWTCGTYVQLLCVCYCCCCWCCVVFVLSWLLSFGWVLDVLVYRLRVSHGNDFPLFPHSSIGNLPTRVLRIRNCEIDESINQYVRV